MYSACRSSGRPTRRQRWRGCKRSAQKHPHLYTLYWATGESDPNSLVESWLDTHAYKAEDRWQGNMRFVIYATQQPASGAWPTQASDTLLGEQIRLNSYALSSRGITSGEVLQLQLKWQAERQPEADYTVFVQLLTRDRWWRSGMRRRGTAPPASGSPAPRWSTTTACWRLMAPRPATTG